VRVWQPELEGPGRVMQQRKKSAVVVWIRKTDTFKAVKEQMASIAKTSPMNRQNSTEWSTSIGGSIRTRRPNGCAFAPKDFHKPEIVVLRLSCYDDVTASVTLKDERQRH